MMSSSKRKKQKSTTGSFGTDGRCTFCNKGSGNEILIYCEDCVKQMHPSCQELRPSMLEIIQTYSWQCGTCKQCIICHGKGNEELMLLCDHCDRGYHRYCLHSKEDLKETEEGWICPVCKVPEPPVRIVKDDEPEYEIVTPKGPQRCNLKKGSSQKVSPLQTKEDKEIGSARSGTPVKRKRPAATKLFSSSKSTLQVTEEIIPGNKGEGSSYPESNLSPEVKREAESSKNFGSPGKADRVEKTVRRSLRNSFVRESLEIKLIDEQFVDSGIKSKSLPVREQPKAIGCGPTLHESGKEFTNRGDAKFEVSPEFIHDAKNKAAFHSSSTYASRSITSKSKKKPSSNESLDISPLLGETKSNLSSAFDRNVEVFKSPIKTYLFKRGRSPRKSQTIDPQERKTMPSQLPRSAKKAGRTFVTQRKRRFSDTDKLTHGEPLLHDTPTSVEAQRDSKSGRAENFRKRALFTDAHSSLSRVSLEKSTVQCPIKGCDGSGNVDPRYSSHHTAIGCPRVKFLRRKRKSKVMILEPEDESPIEFEAKKEANFDQQRKSYPKRERKFLPEATLYGSCAEAGLTSDIRIVTERSSPETISSMESPKREVIKATAKEERKKNEVRKVNGEKAFAKRKEESLKKAKKVLNASPVKKGSQGKILKPKERLTPKKKVIGNVTISPSKKKKERSVKEKGTPISKTSEKNKEKESNSCSRDNLNVSASISDCEMPMRSLSPVTCKELEADVDITSIITQLDIIMFEEARRKAEENLEPEDDDIRDSCIKTIDFGPYEIDTWYVSPYPREYSKLKKLYVCEFCLKYMKSSTILRRHMAKCVIQHPPGDEVYRKGQISVFEVDGEKSKTYCQNLCLLAKLFLDHKTLYYEVGPFLFYVMTEADDKGCHLIGYFSKEKSSFLNYNVACILVMPHYMKKGYGRWLIDFSYVLSQRERKIGTPEHPLSDLGLISYRKYWTDVVLRYLADFQETSISIKEISQKTSIHPNDIVSTLQSLGMVKYWKGKHLLLSKKDLIDEHVKKWEARKKFCPAVDPLFLLWEPKTFAQENIKGPSG